jgi:hypothetical protein
VAAVFIPGEGFQPQAIPARQHHHPWLRARIATALRPQWISLHTSVRSRAPRCPTRGVLGTSGPRRWLMPPAGPRRYEALSCSLSRPTDSS